MKLKDLLTEKRVLQAEIAKNQKELEAVEVLISRIREREGLPPDAALSLGAPETNGNGEKQRRTRGTLKAARAAIDELPRKFTKSELLAKTEQMNPSIAGKIKPEAFRLTLRTLVKEGFMNPTEELSEITGEALYEAVRPV